MKEYVNDISRYAEPIFCLIGNKVDLDTQGLRAVEPIDVTTFKDDHPIAHTQETNAHDPDHIKILFNRVKAEIEKQMNMTGRAPSIRL